MRQRGEEECTVELQLLPINCFVSASARFVYRTLTATRCGVSCSKTTWMH